MRLDAETRQEIEKLLRQGMEPKKVLDEITKNMYRESNLDDLRSKRADRRHFATRADVRRIEKMIEEETIRLASGDGASVLEWDMGFEGPDLELKHRIEVAERAASINISDIERNSDTGKSRRHFLEAFNTIPVALLAISPDSDDEEECIDEPNSSSELPEALEVTEAKQDMQIIDVLAQRLESLAISCRINPPSHINGELRNTIAAASHALDILAIDLRPSDSILPRKKMKITPNNKKRKDYGPYGGNEQSGFDLSDDKALERLSNKQLHALCSKYDVDTARSNDDLIKNLPHATKDHIICVAYFGRLTDGLPPRDNGSSAETSHGPVHDRFTTAFGQKTNKTRELPYLAHVTRAKSRQLLFALGFVTKHLLIRKAMFGHILAASTLSIPAVLRVTFAFPLLHHVASPCYPTEASISPTSASDFGVRPLLPDAGLPHVPEHATAVANCSHDAPADYLPADDGLLYQGHICHWWLYTRGAPLVPP
ncbi:hypothetical protein B0H10DRAFT_2183124 [Mycena sp. CBHHK59/15]|nr:hypothetical protein B0H10DRAFT_2183124 [Mycena sp. CBHHK59/15]